MLERWKRLDLSWQKTRHLYPKSEPHAQADFRKNLAI